MPSHLSRDPKARVSPGQARLLAFAEQTKHAIHLESSALQIGLVARQEGQLSSLQMTADVSAGHHGLYYVVSVVAVQYVDAFLTAIQATQQKRHNR